MRQPETEGTSAAAYIPEAVERITLPDHNTVREERWCSGRAGKIGAKQKTCGGGKGDDTRVGAEMID